MCAANPDFVLGRDLAGERPVYTPRHAPNTGHDASDGQTRLAVLCIYSGWEVDCFCVDFERFGPEALCAAPGQICGEVVVPGKDQDRARQFA
jgi:hypothetical protein